MASFFEVDAQGSQRRFALGRIPLPASLTRQGMPRCGTSWPLLRRFRRHRVWSPCRASTDLEGDDGDDGQQDADNPKARGDFALRHTRFLVVVVQRRHPENAPAFAVLPLGVAEPSDLHDHAQVFDQENPAQDGDEQLFTDGNGKRGDDAAEGQAAGISHEDLSRISVVPQEADAGAHKCGDEHHQLA